MGKRSSTVSCPRCGSSDTIPTSTGWPLPEHGEKTPVRNPPGARLLGVDVIDRVCRKCGHQWLTRARRPR